MSDSLRKMMPPVYHGLFDSFFDKPKIEETRATCGTCAMCDHSDADEAAAQGVEREFFRHDTKCCTFFPYIPNYLLGAILSDPSKDAEEGKARLRTIIASKIGVTPAGVRAPAKRRLLMNHFADAFGRAPSLRCPFFDAEHTDKSCTIWKHRPTVCLTYYCKYSSGRRGFDFWDGMKEYLANVEVSTSRHAMANVDGSVVEPDVTRKNLTVEEIEDLPPKTSEYESWWTKKWVGKEEDFYIKCHEWLRRVTRAEFAKYVDAQNGPKEALAKTKAAYERHEQKLIPLRVVKNPTMRVQPTGEKVVVTTYHRFDSFALDKDLFEVVGLFRANETLKENLERLDKEEGIELAPELIEFLYATGILVEA